ncbi:hypothetical protein CHLRE_12g523340v5 [Chlamydomonas reinhardtii]|uniref:Uncharacterized protein n=1 Tax=Chlamydomonas reinhardtii TaxID=3055 RepID=A0A2K3D484_CHLRE|nr:uncharacterized protein CHLRE_12g523340v5 [Chlamydomonas reinhardtii]PNW75348.1 hypothetical protein CHLRE_12g523340v5 [Chlamydomonas reinhardtii]
MGPQLPQRLGHARQHRGSPRRRARGCHPRPLHVLSSRVAGQVREVLDKSKALQARYGRQLAERVELVKKGSTMGEISRKLAPGQEAPEAARRELKNAIDTVFGAY